MGAKGSKVQKITTDFNVQIKFPDKAMAVENGDGSPAPVNGEINGRSTNPNIIRITGKSKNCAEASQALLELVPITAEVSVPFEFHRFIIGKGGANIRRIRDETDTRVDLPDSGSDSDMITITGKKANVNKAVTEIQKIQNEMANIVSKDVKIPAKIHNTMIGAGGKLIQSIMNECGRVGVIKILLLILYC